jgi:type I restriction enzyme S subunit
MNVRAFRFESKGLLYVDTDFHRQLAKSRLRPGDLAIVRTGAPGICCVIPETLPEANCSDLVIARPGPDLHPGYGCIVMNSSFAAEFVRSNQVGVAQAHFNVGSMKVTPLPLPPLAEQAEIVRRVDALFALADTLEARLATARAQVERLTPALLSKGFRGELVPQDPNDEPASVLLARIRAAAEGTPARAKAKGTPRKRAAARS